MIRDGGPACARPMAAVLHYKRVIGFLDEISRRTGVCRGQASPSSGQQ